MFDLETPHCFQTLDHRLLVRQHNDHLLYVPCLPSGPSGPSGMITTSPLPLSQISTRGPAANIRDATMGQVRSTTSSVCTYTNPGSYRHPAGWRNLAVHSDSCQLQWRSLNAVIILVHGPRTT
jgi:hypothetical protein